jgi:DNA-binding MarR family transcriptional regulator
VTGRDRPARTAAALADDVHDVMGLFRRRSRRLVGTPLPDLGLSGAQLELVRVVRRNPGIGVAEAASALGLAPNTVSTLVGQLTGLDVIVRVRDAADRRIARLELTPSAAAALEHWRDRRTQATVVALDALDAEERAAVARALPLLARVAASLPEPGTPNPPTPPGSSVPSTTTAANATTPAAATVEQPGR